MNNYFSQDMTTQIKENHIPDATKMVDVPTLVRSSNSGDKIYFVKNGTKHWVTSPEVLKALGFDFGQEKEIDKEVMATLQSGEPIRMQNVNEYILPVEEEKPQETPAPIVEAEIVEPMQQVNNAPIEGYISIIIPIELTAEAVSPLITFVAKLKKYFSGEIITVVVNKIDYRDYSDKFGHKVIECEDLQEGVERAERVARGETIICGSR